MPSKTNSNILYLGGVHIPDAQSGRFFVGFWWMYSMVVVATYSGNLIAFLTVTRIYLPFSSLDEMVRDGNFKYGLISGTSTESFFNVRYI